MDIKSLKITHRRDSLIHYSRFDPKGHPFWGYPRNPTKWAKIEPSPVNQRTQRVMNTRLKIYPEKCSGCRLCEMACSIQHLGMVNTRRSAIRIFKDDLEIGACKPVVCIQCNRMLYMEADHPDP